jgi:predicted transcriptional regulator
MAKEATPGMEQKLDEVVRLLRCLVARDMARAGVTQEDIGKHLKIAKAEVGPMVKGLKKGQLVT